MKRHISVALAIFFRTSGEVIRLEQALEDRRQMRSAVCTLRHSNASLSPLVLEQRGAAEARAAG